VIAAGIEVGKRPREACFLAADGRPAGRALRFASTAAGARLLAERLDGLREPASIALEASGRQRPSCVPDGYVPDDPTRGRRDLTRFRWGLVDQIGRRQVPAARGAAPRLP